MGFWSWLSKAPADGESPNPNPASSVGPSYNPGDPRQVMLDPQGPPVANRGLPVLAPSPWSGWPAEWATTFEQFGMRLNALVDTAWTAIDLNASILSAMPMYRVKAGQALAPKAWMVNPAPGVYTSWPEFAKQLFFDYQMGEAFVLALARGSDSYPAALALVPPFLVQFEHGEYSVQGYDLAQQDLLHIRYARSGNGWRGIGPLEVAGARVTASALLDRYQADYLESGGIPRIALETDRPLTPTQVDQQLNEWRASRGGASPTDPAILSGGVKLNPVIAPSLRDAMLVEISQWNEARIASRFVPPFLMGLPSGGDSFTYKSVEMLLDFHYRGSLRPKATAVMSAVSNWALPGGQSVELNGDEYVRPDALARAQAYQLLFNIVDPATGQRALSIDEIRAMERFGADDNADVTAANAMTGGDQ